MQEVATEDEAQAIGKDVFGGKPFYIQTVRPAKLSDFYNPSVLWGEVREQMASKCGDDSLLDSDGMGELQDMIDGNIQDMMDDCAMASAIPFDSLTFVEKERVFVPQLG